jgi:hypothetical protein
LPTVVRTFTLSAAASARRQSGEENRRYSAINTSREPFQKGTCVIFQPALWRKKDE